MPYIPEDNQNLTTCLYPRTPGELTFAFQQAIQGYLFYHGLTYAHIAEVLGSLEGAKLDFNRRVVSVYEARKQAENGDVWNEEFTSVQP